MVSWKRKREVLHSPGQWVYVWIVGLSVWKLGEFLLVVACRAGALEGGGKLV